MNTPVTEEQKKKSPLENCLWNAQERQGYVSFAIAKGIEAMAEEGRTREEMEELRDIIGASSLLHDRIAAVKAKLSAPAPARFRVRLQDPNQPARTYPLEAATEEAAAQEAKSLAAGVLPGGTVEMAERQQDGSFLPVRAGAVRQGKPFRWS